MEFDLVLLTERQYINPVKIDWYVKQVLKEDRLVEDALKKRGLRTCIKSWDDPDFDWTSTHLVLFRSIWDYFNRYEEFSAWLEETKEKTQMLNPYEQIQWNIDKHYLGDLERAGINIVPSQFIEKGDSTGLADWHEQLGWTNTVLKPCVSGAARHTYKLDSSNYDAHDAILQELLEKEAMMLQPFMHTILTKGEVSHMVMGGKYTHSVLKVAKEGDYRVQDDFGGSVHDYEASAKEIEYAEKVAAACKPLPYYARVDVIWDENGELALGEIELIEPELWFRKCPEAADLLAGEIVRRCFPSLQALRNEGGSNSNPNSEKPE